jgi:hypothetical protein
LAELVLKSVLALGCTGGYYRSKAERENGNIVTQRHEFALGLLDKQSVLPASPCASKYGPQTRHHPDLVRNADR